MQLAPKRLTATTAQVLGLFKPSLLRRLYRAEHQPTNQPTMVKSVTGEETRLQQAENRLSQSSTPAEVGLLIGKLTSKLDRAFIFDLVPTPPNDVGNPPCFVVEPPKDDKKKGSSSSKPKSSAVVSSSLNIDKDWVSEHARQVSRMLVGGIKVVGIYVWVGEAAFKNSTLILFQTVKGVAEASSLSMSGWDERLLVHISYSPRRWTCRNCSLASNVTSSSLRPCDFKMGKVLNSLQAFRCIYNFELRLVACREDLIDAKTIHDVLQERISSHAKELECAKAMVDGDLVNLNEDGPCTPNDLHEVELLLPFMNDLSLEASRKKEAFGVLVYSGSVCSYSYLNLKEPVSQALADIKEDIIMSLRNRIDMISDMADGEIASAAEDDSERNTKKSSGESVYQLIVQPLRKQFTVPLPRRVFIPWLAGTFACDYLMPSETFEALKDHFAELLSMEAPEDPSTLLEPEKQISSLTSKSFWDVVGSSCRASSRGCLASKKGDDSVNSVTQKTATLNFRCIFAGIILLISVLLGFLFYTRTSS